MHSGNFTLQFVTLAAVLAATPHQCLASMLFGEQVIEVMKENQGADAAYIGRQFGGDGSSPIQFQSTVDPVSGTFKYFSMPGSTYLGQSLSIMSTGTYDPGSGTWSLETTGSLGGSTWTQDGSGSIVGDPDGAFDWTIPIGGGHFLDFHSKVTYSNTGAHAASEGDYRFTIDDFTIAHAQGTDAYMLQGPNAGSWEWSLSPAAGVNFRVDSSGMSPLDGGAGIFTMTIAAVPEPASLGLIGAGLVILARVGRNRHRL